MIGKQKRRVGLTKVRMLEKMAHGECHTDTESQTKLLVHVLAGLGEQESPELAVQVLLVAMNLGRD